MPVDRPSGQQITANTEKLVEGVLDFWKGFAMPTPDDRRKLALVAARTALEAFQLKEYGTARIFMLDVVKHLEAGK